MAKPKLDPEIAFQQRRNRVLNLLREHGRMTRGALKFYISMSLCWIGEVLESLQSDGLIHTVQITNQSSGLPLGETVTLYELTERSCPITLRHRERRSG